MATVIGQPPGPNEPTEQPPAWPEIRALLLRASAGDGVEDRLYAPPSSPPALASIGLVAATAAGGLGLGAVFDSPMLTAAGLIVATAGLVVGGLILLSRVERESEYGTDSNRVAAADQLVAILRPDDKPATEDQRPLEQQLGSIVGDALMRRRLDRSTIGEALDLARRLDAIAGRRRDAQPYQRGRPLATTPSEVTLQLDRDAESLGPRVHAFANADVSQTLAMGEGCDPVRYGMAVVDDRTPGELRDKRLRREWAWS